MRDELIKIHKLEFPENSSFDENGTLPLHINGAMNFGTFPNTLLQ